MHILLTNDDGIRAEGLRSLYETLKKAYTVTVAAPESQKSAAGHAVSFHKSFRVSRSDIGYAVEGTPADCVKWALLTLKEPIDLVVSGINRGANLGIDVHYSGTVSAAMEAAFYRVPAVAFSCRCKEFRDSAYLAELSAGIIGSLLENPLPASRILNVNYPNLVRGGTPEYVCAPLGLQTNSETMQRVEEDVYAYDGYIDTFRPGTQSDVDYVQDGKICLTPLTWDLTDRDSFSFAERIGKQQQK